MKHATILLAALALACAGCRTAATEAPRSAAPAAASAAEPVAPEHAAEHHDAPRAPAAARPNRDPHGDRDVARYIERLARPERVAELRIDEVVRALRLPEDAVVADLGCGPGLFAVAFAEACPEGYVLAADIEPAQLDALRERLADARVPNVVPVLASPRDPHLPPGRVDLVFVGDTYHHLGDRVAYMSALRRCLRPGGRLAVLEYKPGDLPVGPPAKHKLAEGVREAELAEAGWVRIESFGTHTWHDFEVWRPVLDWEKAAVGSGGKSR